MSFKKREGERMTENFIENPSKNTFSLIYGKIIKYYLDESKDKETEIPAGFESGRSTIIM